MEQPHSTIGPKLPEVAPRATPKQEAHNKLVESMTQAEKAFVELMDQMEASVPEKGNYFWKIGSKEGIPARINVSGKTDRRTLILKEGIPPIKIESEEDNRYVVITRNGLGVITASRGKLNELSYFSSKNPKDAALDGFVHSVDRNYTPGIDTFGNVIRIHEGEGKKLVVKELPLRDISPQEENMVADLMSKSIEAEKEYVGRQTAFTEGESKKQAMARNLLNLLKPSQPPAGEGPAAPPSPPTGL